MEKREKSAFAKSHPLVVLLYLAGGMVFSMACRHPIFLPMAILPPAVYGTWLCGITMWRRLLWGMVTVLLFAAVILPLFSHRGVTPLFYINGQPITWESVLYGVVMSGMLLSVFLWFQIGNVLLDSEKVWYLFAKITPAAGLLISMVFRMIPLMKERFCQIREAQAGLGRTGDALSYSERLHLLIRELSILISWMLEGSLTTAVSMESRGYGTGRRSSFHRFRFRFRDAVCCAVLLVLYGTAFVGMGRGGYGVSYFPAVCFSEPAEIWRNGFFCLLAAESVPLLIEGRKRV